MASHGTNAAASGMRRPLLRTDGAKRVAMSTTRHAVSAHSATLTAVRATERRCRSGVACCAVLWVMALFRLQGGDACRPVRL